MRLFRVVIAISSVASILLSGLPALANQTSSMPAAVLLRFGVGNCDSPDPPPYAVFGIPSGATPVAWEFTSSDRSGGPIVRTKPVAVQGSEFKVDLKFSDRYVTPWLVYRDDMGQEVRIHGNSFLYSQDGLKFFDSTFCTDERRKKLEKKRAEEELQSKLPKLTNLSLKYFGSSLIHLDLKAQTAEPLMSMEILWTKDNLNWTPGGGLFYREALVGRSKDFTISSGGEIKIGLSDRGTFTNVVGLRIRAKSKLGWGDWLTIETGRPVGPSTLPVDTTYSVQGYTLETQPILLPEGTGNRRPPLGCTFSTVHLRELNSTEIERTDQFRVETSIEEEPYWPNEAYPDGVKSLTTFQSLHNPEEVGFNIWLCPERVALFEPRYLRVKITRLSTGFFIEGKIPVVSKQATGTLNKTIAMQACEANGVYRTNVLIEQTQVQKTSKQSSELKGTLFRAGLVAPGQKYFVYALTSKGPTLIASGFTDKDGQFAFSAKFAVGKKNQRERLLFTVDDASGLSVPFSTVIEAGEIPLEMVWTEKGLTYVPSSVDWIPSLGAGCVRAIEAPGSPLSGDEKNHVAWFIAKQVYYGMKGKASKNVEESRGPSQKPTAGGSSAGSGSSVGGKKCTWVNSYTRKSGTRVSGHWRCS